MLPKSVVARLLIFPIRLLPLDGAVVFFGDRWTYSTLRCLHSILTLSRGRVGVGTSLWLYFFMPFTATFNTFRSDLYERSAVGRRCYCSRGTTMTRDCRCFNFSLHPDAKGVFKYKLSDYGLSTNEHPSLISHMISTHCPDTNISTNRNENIPLEGYGTHDWSKEEP